MKNRVAFITGSSRGIGAAIARSLVGEGWKVILHFVKDEAQARALHRELGEGVLGIVQGDLADAAATRDLWERAVRLAPVTALVNNAGIYLPQPFEAPGDDWEAVRRRTMRINFEAPCELIHLALPSFLDRGEGKVLSVGSRVGFRGEPGAAFYAASKAALLNLTRSLAVEFAPKGIQFFGIAPGWVQTAMAREGMENRLPEILAGIPAGRMATPEDCGNAAAFLLRSESEYLTGEIIDINGASYFH